MKEPAHFSPDKGIFLRMPEGNLIAQGYKQKKQQGQQEKEQDCRQQDSHCFQYNQNDM